MTLTRKALVYVAVELRMCGRFDSRAAPRERTIVHLLSTLCLIDDLSPALAARGAVAEDERGELNGASH